MGILKNYKEIIYSYQAVSYWLVYFMRCIMKSIIPCISLHILQKTLWGKWCMNRHKGISRFSKFTSSLSKAFHIIDIFLQKCIDMKPINNIKPIDNLYKNRKLHLKNSHIDFCFACCVYWLNEILSNWAYDTRVYSSHSYPNERLIFI